MNKKSNMEIADKYWRRMEEESKINPGLSKVCHKVNDEGLAQKVFELFLLDRSYVPGVYEDLPFWLDLDSTVALIRNAGGLALFAHPDPNILSFDEMEKILTESRMDGMEVVFSLFEHGTHLEEENKKNMRIVSEIAERCGKLAGGGVDAHKREELSEFVENEDYSNRTVGMVERIVEKSGVSTEWSSL